MFALYNRFKVPKLYRYANNGDWDLIPQRCETNPKEAEFVHAFPPSDTALHCLLRTATASMDELDQVTQQHIEQVKLQAVSALLKANPLSASARDAFGRTPLHIACMDIENCGEVVAVMIMESCERAATMVDVEGRSPLHYLVGRNDVVPLSLLSKLIAGYPKALSIQDNVSETPVDIVASRGDEILDAARVIEILKTSSKDQPSPPTSSRRLRSVSSTAATVEEESTEITV